MCIHCNTNFFSAPRDRNIEAHRSNLPLVLLPPLLVLVLPPVEARHRRAVYHRHSSSNNDNPFHPCYALGSHI
ncbi:unnamed protein product [Trichogramma brassicae]|uniref:Uncharacterized protein n=1 Tax=Trichogramma brassicae TaxID=86971 RepID=A0A6H5J929_9HYME|nr:unnamed protein product [Trichogramma brassicae]